MGTPGWLQRSVFVVGRAVTFSAEKAVLEGMVVGDVRLGPGFELCKFVGGEGCRAE